jgi:DNA-binding response OmpR family regulator
MALVDQADRAGEPSSPPALLRRIDELMARTVLIVDDEPHIADVLRAYLERDGYSVVTAHDGDAALDAISATDLDLVVLDVMLPGRSGFDVLRTLRAAGSTLPVVLLTARDDVIDRVAGLELGADDYVVKPFEPREVVARVGAVLRRSDQAARTVAAPASPAGGTVSESPPTSHFWDLVIAPAAREVRRAASPIELTRTEFDLLAALTSRPDIVWTREQLGAAVFGERFEAFDRTLDSHVKNLRHKLDPRPDGGSYVETVRGVGYRAARGATTSS